MNIIGIETFRSYLLTLFAFLGSILASLEAIWRTQKVRLQNSFQKNRFLRMEIIPIFGGQYCSKTEIKEGY